MRLHGRALFAQTIRRRQGGRAAKGRSVLCMEKQMRLSHPEFGVMQRDAVCPEVFGKNRKRFGNYTTHSPQMQKIGINLALFGKLAENE